MAELLMSRHIGVAGISGFGFRKTTLRKPKSVNVVSPS